MLSCDSYCQGAHIGQADPELNRLPKMTLYSGSVCLCLLSAGNSGVGTMSSSAQNVIAAYSYFPDLELNKTNYIKGSRYRVITIRALNPSEQTEAICALCKDSILLSTLLCSWSSAYWED